MYENLVAWLRDKDFEQICPCGDESICEGKDCAVLQAADAIEELSRELDSANELVTALDGVAPRWIPVTERLPDAEPGNVSQQVLVTDGKDVAIVGWFNFEECGPYWGYTGFGKDVTHWMPLPKPPEGGADG